MAALGAELTIVPSESGRTTKQLILDMIETARRMSKEPRTFWVNQLENEDSVGGYHALGEEIWAQTNGSVSAFVHAVGAAASSRGVATVLKQHNPMIQNIVVEPAESAVLGAGLQALTTSRGSESAERLRYGVQLSSTTSSPFLQMMPKRWRGGSHGRRVSLPAHPPARTSSVRFRWQSGLGAAPQSSP